LSRRSPHSSDARIPSRVRTSVGPWRWSALALAVALLMAFKPPVWSRTEELAGTIVLSPGESASLRIRTAMENDRGVATWEVGLGIVRLSVSGDDSPDSGGPVVNVSGQVEGEAASTCDQTWEDPDTGTSVWNDCDVEATCPDGASTCEAVVEFHLLSTSDAPVTVDWVASARVDGALGCAGNPDKVEASLELETLD